MNVANERQTEARVVAAPQQNVKYVVLAALWGLLAFCALVAASLVPPPAHATVRARVANNLFSVDRQDWVRQGPVEVSVRVAGRTTPLFQASNRLDRWYVEAREGKKYEVRVRNVTSERVAFLIVVDGINAINGQISRLSSDEPMYVLDPWGNATIKGWRKDMRNVSQFVFVDEERSYAERTGQGNGDLGWIRVLAYREAQPYISQRLYGGRELDRKEAAPAPSAPSGPYRERAGQSKSQSRADDGRMAPAPSVDGQSMPGEPMAESSPGTGWGRNERDDVRRVEFEPEHYASGQVVVRYEYKGALTALGILPWRAPSRDRLWERENGLYGFAQPPRR
ncbi:MAG: hypothetical protein ACREOU_00410 [Candidatus Eiseniibacteriota bacterium]